MKPNLSKFSKALSKHSPEILTGLGIAGMIFSTVYAVKATPKALILIEGRKKVLDTDKLSVKDTIKVAWKCYIPSAAMTVASTACLIGATSVNCKRNAMIAAAYELSEETFREYRNKVTEVVGENKEQQVRDEIAKDKVEKNPPQSNEVIVFGKDAPLCYESISGRYFKCHKETIDRAEITLNKMLFSEEYASLNDFYYEIGLDPTDIGDSIGWNVAKSCVDVVYSSQLTPDGTPCLVISYSTPPTYGFDTYA